jgi:hypothetical protein
VALHLKGAFTCLELVDVLLLAGLDGRASGSSVLLHSLRETLVINVSLSKLLMFYLTI